MSDASEQVQNRLDAASEQCPAPEGAGLSVVVEQLAAARPTGCSAANRPYLLGFSRSGITVWRPDCHMWTCPYCGRQKANHLVHVIAYGVHWYKSFEPRRQWSFVTLTARGDRRGATRSLDDFRKAWPKLRKRITRAYGKFHYAAVPECHKDGTIHLHMLIDIRFEDAKQYHGRDGRDYWKSRWLARACTACGIGWRHDCQPIDSETGAASYVAKYAAKMVANDHFDKGVQRYRTSNHWPRHDDGTPARESDLVWMTVQPANLVAVLRYYVAGGFHIIGRVQNT